MVVADTGTVQEGTSDIVVLRVILSTLPWLATQGKWQRLFLDQTQLGDTRFLPIS